MSLEVCDHKVVGSNMAVARDNVEAACQRIWKLGPGWDAFPAGVAYSA